MKFLMFRCSSLLVSEIPTPLYGEKLRQQVEDRLVFYETGDVPKKNADVMLEAAQEVNKSLADELDVAGKRIKSSRKTLYRSTFLFQ